MVNLLKTFTFLLLFCCINGMAQDKPFKQLVEELKDLCFQHGTLYDDSGMIALKDAGITHQILRKEYPDEFEISDNKDSIDIGSLKYYYQLKIKQKFNEVMHHPDLLKHDLSQMFSYMLVSDDKKLYSLSIDENTGGSYHSRITFYHYTGLANANETVFEGFARDGYQEIYTLKTGQGTKYLLIGSVVTCNTCMAAYALLTHFENGKLVHDFETIIDGRMGSEITFDPNTEILSVDYHTDDLIRECFCENGTAEVGNDNKIAEENTLIIRECGCKYAFDGGTFELTSQQSKIAEE